MSPSIPVISEIEITLRVPSLRRDICTMILIAEADCWRIAFSGRFSPDIAAMVSKPGQSVARGVCVDGCERAIMAGVHRLQHVDRFFAADLAEDDPIRTHTEGVDYQLPLPHGALAFNVWRARFQPDDVLLAQLQFRRIFNRDNAFAIGNVGRKDVQHRRFSGTRAA